MADDSDYIFRPDLKSEDDGDIVIGIDLGTTNSCGCIWRSSRPELIPDEHGNFGIAPEYGFQAPFRIEPRLLRGIVVFDESEVGPLVKKMKKI